MQRVLLVECVPVEHVIRAVAVTHPEGGREEGDRSRKKKKNIKRKKSRPLLPSCGLATLRFFYFLPLIIFQLVVRYLYFMSSRNIREKKSLRDMRRPRFLQLKILSKFLYVGMYCKHSEDVHYIHIHPSLYQLPIQWPAPKPQGEEWGDIQLCWL